MRYKQAAFEKKEELEEQLEEVEDEDAASADKLAPLVKAAEVEYEKKEADADAALKLAEEAENAADAAAKGEQPQKKGWKWGFGKQ